MSRYIGTRPEIILQSIQLMPDAKNYHLKFCRKEIKRLRKIIQISSERLKKLEAFLIEVENTNYIQYSTVKGKVGTEEAK